MNLAKRAGLYTIRQKQKSILLFLVLVLVSTLVLTGISIESAVNDTFEDMHRDIAGKLNLERNPPEIDHYAILEAFEQDGMEGSNREFAEQMNSGDFVTFDTLNAIMAISGVISYNITAEFVFNNAKAENFDFLFDDDQPELEGYDGSILTLANLQSSTNSERMDGFVNGNLRLISGRHLTADDRGKVLISDELAEYNNIYIGDNLKISGAPMALNQEVPDTILELEVVGIYSGTRGMDASTQITHPGNILIIDMSTTMEEHERADYFGTGAVGSLPGSLSIFIEDPNEIDDVYDEIANLSEVYGKNFALTMGTEGFEEVLTSLSSLQGLVQTLLVIIALVSMAIIAILLTIWTHGRVKEIGIYLANGIKKREIISQFILEAILIAAVSFALSLPISQVTAQGAGDYILSQFTAAQELRAEQLEDSSPINTSHGGIDIGLPETGFMNEANIENTLDMVDVTVLGRDLIWVYVIGLTMVTCSVLIASYSVVKLKPKEILSKMS